MIPSLPTLDPRLFWSAPSARPRFPFDGLGQAHLFYLARGGVHHAIRAFLDGRPGTVLLPAYHHGVEVEAVRAAGARVRFYRVDDEMRVDLDDLARRARAPDVRVVYLTHFVGFAQPVEEVRALCDRRGQRLVEDCALALYSADPRGRPLGTLGDAAVFCLYKTLPVPHGGLLYAPELPLPTVSAPPIASTLHHLAGQLLGHFERAAPHVGRAARHLARRAAHRTVDLVVDTVRTGSMHLTPRELGLGASRVVAHLCARVDAAQVVARRRRNFRRLATALAGVVPVIGAPLADGACPLFVPVRVDDKPRLLAELLTRGIEAVDFWSSGDPACDARAFPEVTALRRHVLELPCHQSLDDADIDHVAHVVKQVMQHA
jgi:selenocysteine lyase/cysteine desulfurase